MACINAPLLPLPNVVFFPKTALPIYVDTPSYGRMIRDCVMNGLPIVVCMAYIQDLPPDQHGLARQQLRPAIIGSLGVPYILEEYPGGAMKVLIKGITRARLISPTQNLPYPIYKVEILTGSNCDTDHLCPPQFAFQVGGQGATLSRASCPSQDSSPQANALENQNPKGIDGQLAHINNILEAWVMMNVTNSEERKAFFSGLETTEHIANYVSMLLIRDFEIRQTLLETDSLLDRIHLLGALLRDGIPLKEDREVVGAIKQFETLERLARAAN
ncbi:MAG: LON peptidase substrate-binding domain-containing protein [Bdellovibrio sp.]|nr:LON peptidase substrate-binding domain-containing protein [Bdellovibrio sp.]